MIFIKNLLEFKVLLDEVFYKGWNIIEYIEKHPNMSELDEDAIKATIMDALVSKGLINPASESLDLKKLCITQSVCHYRYEKNPNVCGFPLWMKRKFRNKSILISKGVPISIFLTNPSYKSEKANILYQNLAVSAIFEDATFYNAIYDSPTEGSRIEEPRQFVEINISGELYLVDVLTNRMFKSKWFKEKYNFEVINQWSIKELEDQGAMFYKNSTSEKVSLSEELETFIPSLSQNTPDKAEEKYELEQSKRIYPQEWQAYITKRNQIYRFDVDQVSGELVRKIF